MAARFKPNETPILPIDELTLAIEIHARSYRLLRWLGGAMEEGFVPVRRAHDYAEAADAALDWIEEHFQNLPPDARPDPEWREPFARYFSTYVTTSFDIVVSPGLTLTSGCGCYCSVCSYLAQAPHLQTKKVTARDKKVARSRMIDRVVALAMEEGLSVDDATAERVATSSATARAAAYSTYGYWLIERTRGYTQGPAILALWRKIAWNQSGSPIPSFALRVEDFVVAEQQLLEALA